MRVLFFCLALLFAAPALAADDLMGMYQSYAGDTESDISKPHRGINELGRWLSETVANALQYKPGQNAAKLSEIRPLFSDQGFKTYMDFMAAQGLTDALASQKLYLNSIVNSEPLLVGQGSSAGRYAWAYDMSIILSTAPGTQGPDNASKAFTLRVQIGRSAKAPAPQGVLIESWTAIPAPANDDGGKPAGNP